MFKYNDIASLEALVDRYPGQFACVVLEPAALECPAIGDQRSDCCGQSICSRPYAKSNDNFLQQVQKLCAKHGIVFVLDEMITGFRWHMKGAQHLYDVTPDLSTFGKAMANGFSVACVAGRREIMQLGSIEFEGRERVFLLSTTHGAEMCGLGAFVATMKFMKKNHVIEHLWEYGNALLNMMSQKAASHGLSQYFRVAGVACSPYYLTFDASGVGSMPLRTLFSQEMIRQGVLMPWIALSYRHGAAELAKTAEAVDAALVVYKQAVADGVDKYLVGPAIKPVFRKHN